MLPEPQPRIRHCYLPNKLRWKKIVPAPGTAERKQSVGLKAGRHTSLSTSKSGTMTETQKGILGESQSEDSVSLCMRASDLILDEQLKWEVRLA